MGHFRPLFPYFRLVNTDVDSKQMFNITVCQWLDSNCGPLVLEVTALPTEPKPPWDWCLKLLCCNCCNLQYQCYSILYLESSMPEVLLLKIKSKYFRNDNRVIPSQRFRNPIFKPASVWPDDKIIVSIRGDLQQLKFANFGGFKFCKHLLRKP